MKLYYQCTTGISGDMNLGAMIDLGVPVEYLKSELSKLGLDAEFTLKVSKASKHGIFGTKVDVIDHNAHEHHDHGHAHAHGHGHHHSEGEHHGHHHHEHVHGHTYEHGHTHEHPHIHGRNYREIRGIIAASALSARSKEIAQRIFHIIAEAEARQHHVEIDDVHFHEVGAIDSIVDIVGAAICYDYLNVTEISCSTVELGSGYVRCAHGRMPIPAPATAAILIGIPAKSTIHGYELTTPTGAAILKAMASEFSDDFCFQSRGVGAGVGTLDLDVPNMLRVFAYDDAPTKHTGDRDSDRASDRAILKHQRILETNLDDMTAENLAGAEQALFEAGALDVYRTPIVMKKGRLATKLSVLVAPESEEAVRGALFAHTTAIGLRSYTVEKYELERSIRTYGSSVGPIRTKVSGTGETLTVKPEYEELRNRVQFEIKVKAMMEQEPVFDELIRYLKSLGSVTVAYSGGVDSTLLAFLAKRLLGDFAQVVSVVTPYVPNWEQNEAEEYAVRLGIDRVVIPLEIPESIRNNPEDRCYLCKQEIFESIQRYANEAGSRYVIDGTNYDDTKEHRPGLKALEEHGVRSPFKQLGITKEQIRAWSRYFELPSADKPANACTLTRIPHNTPIEPEDLRRIEEAEGFLATLGYRGFRVRKHGEIARIEGDIQAEDRPIVCERLRSLGFRYVTVDLAGYQKGWGK